MSSRIKNGSRKFLLVAALLLLTSSLQPANAALEHYYATWEANDSNYYFAVATYYGEFALYYDSPTYNYYAFLNSDYAEASAYDAYIDALYGTSPNANYSYYGYLYAYYDWYFKWYTWQYMYYNYLGYDYTAAAIDSAYNADLYNGYSSLYNGLASYGGFY
jgi:hypothetical protein